MYNYLKNNYGLGKKIISVAIFLFVAILILSTSFSFALQIPISGDVSFVIFAIIFNAITLGAGIAVHLYIRKTHKKKPYKKIYFFITITLVVLFCIVFSPVLVFGNALLRLTLWIMDIPQIIIKEKWYLLLVGFSICLTAGINNVLHLNYKELISVFISIYLAFGLCFCVIPYILFYSETKTYFTDFLSHSLMLLFSVTLILNVVEFISRTDGEGTVFLALLNVSTIMVAWKRVYDYSMHEKSKNKLEEKLKVDIHGKNVLMINSSYNKKNTFNMLQRISTKLEQRDLVVEIVNLFDYRIENCTGCQECLKTGKCPIEDDADILMNKMLESNGIVISTPVYFDNISGKLKIFVERTVKWCHVPELAGKPILFVASSESNNTKQTKQSLESIAFSWGTPIAGFIARSSINIEREISESTIPQFLVLIEGDTAKYKPSYKEIEMFQTQKANALVKSKEYIKNYWEDRNLLHKNYYYECKIGFLKTCYSKLIFIMKDSTNEVDDE